MASISLVILLLLILISLSGRINVGWLAVLAAIALGYLARGESSATVMARFPSDLFLTLLGLCFFFSLVESNGTLERIFVQLQSLARCGKRSFPWLHFALAALLASLGAGNIAATALMAPMAMVSCQRYKLSPLLMTVMVANGANAGALSPLAPAGIILRFKLEALGIAADPSLIFLFSLFVHFLLSLVAYLVLGEIRQSEALVAVSQRTDWNREQILTAVTLFSIVAVATFGGIGIGPLSITAAILLSLIYPKESQGSLRSIPWNILIMVCGFSLYVSILELTGGIDLLASWLAGNVPEGWLPGSIAFLSAAVSSFSSSTAVVLPTFLPMIPPLVPHEMADGGFRLAASVAIGSHLVDASPLSTIGALCVAASPEGSERKRLFRQTLFWGLAMIPVSGLVCQALFGF